MSLELYLIIIAIPVALVLRFLVVKNYRQDAASILKYNNLPTNLHSYTLKRSPNGIRGIGILVIHQQVLYLLYKNNNHHAINISDISHIGYGAIVSGGDTYTVNLNNGARFMIYVATLVNQNEDEFQSIVSGVDSLSTSGGTDKITAAMNGFLSYLGANGIKVMRDPELDAKGKKMMFMVAFGTIGFIFVLFLLIIVYSVLFEI